ncbi:unnamed protein product [Urochloa humidicola]
MQDENKMPPAVRTRRITAVALPTGVDHAPLPPPGRRVALSPFDAYWAALPPIRRVFLFAPPSPPVPFAHIAGALRSSLAAVLPAFHPFAGELVHDPAEPRPVAIACGEGAGVAFVEAETELDFARLAEEGAEHDVGALQQLVPDIRRDELPAPVMAAQVTEFIGGGGGIAVGVTLHHAAADGRGLWRFLEMWAAAAAGSETVPVAGEPASPLHDRSLVSFEGDDELARIFLRQVAPDLPRIVSKTKTDPSSGPQNQLSRRTFTLSSSVIQRLKQQLAAATGTATAPSTFAAVVAHGWVSIARASGFTDAAPVFATFLADIRAHMSPRVPDAYVGNCLALCVVAMAGAELTGPHGPSRACLAIGEAVAEVRRDPLAGRARWFSMFEDIPRGHHGGVAVVPRVRGGFRVWAAGEGGAGVHEPRRRDGPCCWEGGRLGAGFGGISPPARCQRSASCSWLILDI